MIKMEPKANQLEKLILSGSDNNNVVVFRSTGNVVFFHIQTKVSRYLATKTNL